MLRYIFNTLDQTYLTFELPISLLISQICRRNKLVINTFEIVNLLLACFLKNKSFSQI